MGANGPKKIAILNYKGGTGKTATAVNLACGLARRNKRVLLIDVDPQGSSGHHLGVHHKLTLYDLLMKKNVFNDVVVNARPNLDFICSNEHLFPAEMMLAKQENREFALSKCLDSLQDGYEYILMDCAPSMSLMSQNVLVYVDSVMLPVSMEYLSLIGVKQLLKNIKIINRLFSKNVMISHVVPTFYDRRNKKSHDVLESLYRVFHEYVTPPIRVSVDLSEAPGSKQTVYEYNPTSKSVEDYENLVNEVIGNDG